MIRKTLTLAFAIMTLTACSCKDPSYCSTTKSTGSSASCNASRTNHQLSNNKATDVLVSAEASQQAIALAYTQFPTEASQLNRNDARKTVETSVRVNHAVAFERGSELMPEEINDTLLPHARYLVANPHRKVLLTPHVSDHSNDVASIALCQDRIEGVVRALLTLGVDPSQILTNKSRLCETSKNADFVELTY